MIKPHLYKYEFPEHTIEKIYFIPSIQHCAGNLSQLKTKKRQIQQEGGTIPGYHDLDSVRPQETWECSAETNMCVYQGLRVQGGCAGLLYLLLKKDI